MKLELVSIEIAHALDFSEEHADTFDCELS